MKQKILIASDHAAVELKDFIKRTLKKWQWEDMGPDGSKSVDYPDYAARLARRLAARPGLRGILICGTGIGMSIAANKIRGIRAALACNPVTARLSREHNDANILCLGARLLAPEYAAEIASVWLETPFSEDGRHTRRIRKIHGLEKSGRGTAI
ncbi:MAG: ribose 5-phosphate isomerase B [Bdellovibrionales bacterium RIFOXYD1_FULL_53_11]|nr:MAG: ribose 5-phosphate isomerase B [Bdellovibrionales bacterium RIFOXYD1_FULL_53_11]